MGTFDSDYEATVTATLASGKKFAYKNMGHYKSVGYANGVNSCETVKLKDVPQGANIGQTNKAAASKTGGKRAKRFTSRLARFIHGNNY